MIVEMGLTNPVSKRNNMTRMNPCMLKKKTSARSSKTGRVIAADSERQAEMNSMEIIIKKEATSKGFVAEAESSVWFSKIEGEDDDRKDGKP